MLWLGMYQINVDRETFQVWVLSGVVVFYPTHQWFGYGF
jgi:hypothetical protein